MGARRMSRGACAHAWSAGDLGSWLQVRGVEVVEDLVDLNAGELVLVGERPLDGVGDEITGFEWPGVAVGGQAAAVSVTAWRRALSIRLLTVLVLPG